MLFLHCRWLRCWPFLFLFLMVGHADAAILITKQPQNTTLDIGETLRLSVEYSSGQPSAILWTLNDQPVTGATSTNLVITNMVSAKAGTYRALLVENEVTNRSEPALVSVNGFSSGPVGYISLQVSPGFQLLTFPLRFSHTVKHLFGTLPPGISLFKMDGNGFRLNNCADGWMDPDMLIVPGEAVFVHNATAENVTLTTAGSVFIGQITTQMPQGFSALGSLIPRSGAIYNIFALPPNLDTVLYRFDKATQQFIGSAWPYDSPVLSLEVGEGFYAYSPTAQVWQTFFDYDLEIFGFGSYHLVVPSLPASPAQFYFDTFGTDDAFGRVLEMDGIRPLGGSYSAQVYMGISEEEASLQPAGKPVAARKRFNGRLHGPLMNVPSHAGGTTLYAQLRVWETSYGPTYEQAVQNGSRHGKSAITSYTVRSVITGSQPAAPPLPFNSFPTFSVQMGTDFSTRLTDIEKNAQGMKLWFIAQPGKNYRVLFKDALTASVWTVLAGAENIAGNDTEVTFADPGATSCRFYRIQELP